jgi:hypothetical protein
MAHLRQFMLHKCHFFFKIIDLLFHDCLLAFAGWFGKGRNDLMGKIGRFKNDCLK